MTKDEALKMALKAFEWNYNTDLDNIPACEKWAKMLKENIAAIKEALAQPEQKPVAWMDEFGNVFPLGAQRGPKHLNEPMKPLYTTPPQRTWVGLTDEEISELIRATHNTGSFVRAIEAKLKEKNT